MLKSPKIQLEEVGNPISFNWNKCKLETISFGHGITTTPLQAVSVYSALTNGGILVEPNLIRDNKSQRNIRLFSEKTSENINKILRKVVVDDEGTANFANIHGYNVAGKTGTSQNYYYKNISHDKFL